MIIAPSDRAAFPPWIPLMDTPLLFWDHDR